MPEDKTIKLAQEKQKVSGVLLIDKPQGMTSQQVVSKVKYLLKSPLHNSKKAGHTGTLDPMATGLLPICMGEATKFSHYQLEADKAYTATIKLGVKTDTGDAQGCSVDTKPVPTLTQKALDNVAQKFMGDIEQIPPMYSALKKEGKKLYEYARQGIEVERQPRAITIKSLSLTLSEQDDAIELAVTCTKGTYVRVLGEDIANALGTYGHLSALRRIQVGFLAIEQAITLADFESLSLEERLKQLLPVDECIKNLPVLIVDDQQCQRLHLGQRLNVLKNIDNNLLKYMDVADSSNMGNNMGSNIDSNVDSDEITYDVRLFNEANLFLGLGKLERNGRLQPKKMIQY